MRPIQCSTYLPEQHIRVAAPLRDDAFQITAAYKLEQFLSPFFDVVAVKLSDMSKDSWRVVGVQK
jgi:hypothetical protein